MCSLFFIILLCVLIPVWVKERRRRTHNRELAERLLGMDGLVEDLVDPAAFRDGQGDEEEDQEGGGQNRR